VYAPTFSPIAANGRRSDRLFKKLWVLVSCDVASCRLFSSAHFNDSFPQHSDPEVLKTPLEGVALMMKAMGIDKVRVLPHCSPCLKLNRALPSFHVK